MKRLSFIFISVLISSSAIAQYGSNFFRGFGIFGAATQSMHRYKNTDEGLKNWETDTPNNFNMTYYYPQSHYSREFFSWGAGIFAEFGSGDYGRWQTEIEYANKGAREKEVIDPFIGTRSGSFSTNKNTYIQWNNYLKYFAPFGLPSNIYLMPGIRLEYLFRKNNNVFTSVSNNFPRFWFSGNVGVGYEFPLFRKFSGFVEYHWNPDIIFHKTDNIKVRNRTFELRVGIMYRPRKRSIDDCNAPRYKGPAY